MNEEEMRDFLQNLASLTESDRVTWTQEINPLAPATTRIGNFNVTFGSRDDDGRHPYYVDIEKRDFTHGVSRVRFTSGEVWPDLFEYIWSLITRRTSGVEEFTQELFRDVRRLTAGYDPVYGDEEPF